MFGAPLPVHQCQTGHEVAAHARAVREKRKALFAVSKIEPPPPPPPIIEALPEIAFDIIEPIPSAPYEPQQPLTFLQPPPLGHPSIREIQSAVCEVSRVGIKDILSSRRTASIVRPRFIAIALCKKLTLRSLPEIGRKFGNRDHTTVLHAIRRMGPVVVAAEASLPKEAKPHEWADAMWRFAKTVKLADYDNARAVSA